MDLECRYCSFCGKSDQEVLSLIAGPTVFICDECVELCVEIIEEAKAERRPHFDWIWHQHRKAELATRLGRPAIED